MVRRGREKKTKGQEVTIADWPSASPLFASQQILSQPTDLPWVSGDGREVNVSLLTSHPSQWTKAQVEGKFKLASI